MNRIILGLITLLLFCFHITMAEDKAFSVVCFDPSTIVGYGVPQSDGVCCSNRGTDVITANVIAYPDAPYGTNYGSISTNRVDNWGTVTVTWNGNWTGKLEFLAGSVQYKAAVFPLGGACGGVCNTTTATPHRYIITRLSADFSPPSFVGCPLNLEVRKGDNLTFGWNPPGGGYFQSSPIYILDNGASIGMPYSTNNLSIGEHKINSSVVMCGKTFLRECIFKVLPSCAYDNLSSIKSGSSILSAEAQGGGYANGGGYKVTPGVSYTINIAGITDLWTNYYLEHNGGSDIIFTPPNQFIVKPSVTIGSYRFEFEKTNSTYPNCPNPPAFRIYVGGSDVVFESECSIVLPDYLFQNGYSINDPILLEHFKWTVKSEESIIIRDNGTDNMITLVDGAELKIIEGPEIIKTNDPDYNRNIVENTSFDDYGNVIASSRMYADSRGQIIQVQKKDISAGIVLASVTINDGQDRPSINSLPAPVSYRETSLDECGEIALPWENLKYAYKAGFINVSGNASAFTYSNFDDVKLGHPDLIANDVPGTLGWYYSDNNNSSSSSVLKEPLVTKTNYPYSQAEYKNDGTDQITSAIPQGNVYRSETGHQHKAVSKIDPILQNDPDVLKWLQMRAEFSSINPSSLVENAVKNTIIDQHGVETYSISDKSGKEIISVHKNVDPSTLVVTKTYGFNFYDDAGRLKYAVTPNGVDQYFKASPVAFSLIDKTSYEYNYRGWLLAINESDAGRTEYKYRKDGSIRFSQNAEQRAANPQRYSYTNYDWRNRVIESGEYALADDGVAWSAINATILEDRSITGGIIGSKWDATKIYFDGENGFNTAPYIQDFVMGRVSCTTKNDGTKTWYSYDERGRTVWMAKNIPGLGIKKIEYTYDSKGGVKEVAYQRGQSGEEFYHVYEYDDDARLKKVYTTTVTPVYSSGLLINGTEQAEYKYYLHGPLKRIELAENLQGIDYLYTVEGWLKSINSHDKNLDPGADGNDVFGMSLLYYSGDYTKTGVQIINPTTGTQYYNGNITASFWYSKKPSSIPDAGSFSSYLYEYDSKYQLKNAFWSYINGGSLLPLPQYKEGNIAYDLNGNIKTLQRFDVTGLASASQNFGYNYLSNKNQLESVSNVGSSPATNYASYQYNAIGQLKSITKGTTTNYPHYNVRGLMTSVSTDTDGNNNMVKYYYGDDGLRYKKQTFNNNAVLIYETYYVHDASGNTIAVYDNNNQTQTLQKTETYVYGNSRIGVFKNAQYEYELNDHLGNVRATIRKYMNAVDVVSYTDYYPYGMVLRTGGANQRYGYQGKFAEKDEETGWNAFELRMYDGVVGRWMGIDPYRQFASSYMGMGNNPLYSIDPDGGETTDWGKKDINGKTVYKWFDRNVEDGWEFVSTEYAYVSRNFNTIMQENKNTIFDISGYEVHYIQDFLNNVSNKVQSSKGNSSGPSLEGNTSSSSLQGEVGFYKNGGWQTLIMAPAAVVASAFVAAPATTAALGTFSLSSIPPALYAGGAFLLPSLNTATTSGLNPSTSLIKFSLLMKNATVGIYDYYTK